MFYGILPSIKPALAAGYIASSPQVVQSLLVSGQKETGTAASAVQSPAFLGGPTHNHPLVVALHRQADQQGPDVSVPFHPWHIKHGITFFSMCTGVMECSGRLLTGWQLRVLMSAHFLE